MAGLGRSTNGATTDKAPVARLGRSTSATTNQAPLQEQLSGINVCVLDLVHPQSHVYGMYFFPRLHLYTTARPLEVD